jgi:hypothetical protein
MKMRALGTSAILSALLLIPVTVTVAGPAAGVVGVGVVGGEKVTVCGVTTGGV